MTLELPKEYLHECLDFEPETGFGTWRLRPRNHFPTERGWKIFNKLYAGKIIGGIGGDGYINIEIDGIAYRFHRIAWVWMTGEWPEKFIDHINGVRDDNRWCNLREVNEFGNTKNASIRTDNTSGCTGLSWLERLQKWEVSIYVNKRSIYLGVFSDKDEAIRVRKEAEAKYGFHPMHGRSK